MNELIAQELLDTIMLIIKGLGIGLVVVGLLVGLSAYLRARR